MILSVSDRQLRWLRFPRPPFARGCHPMAPPGTSWHYRTEPSFPNSVAITVLCRIPGTASEAGGRAFAAKRSFASARQRSCPANRARVTITFPFTVGDCATGSMGAFVSFGSALPGFSVCDSFPSESCAFSDRLDDPLPKASARGPHRAGFFSPGVA
jgi:hypothetical protein